MTVENAGRLTPLLSPELQQQFEQAVQNATKSAAVTPLQFAAQAASLLAALRTMQSQESVEGRPAPQGAPALEQPSEDFSADALALALQSLNAKIKDAQLKTSKEGLELSAQQKKEMNEEAMATLEEIAEKAEEARNASDWQKAFGWISKVVSLVIAVVAAVASPMFGPVAMAVAAQNLVNTTMALVNAVREEQGMEALDVPNFLDKMTTGMLTACGVDEETAEKIAPIINGAAAMLSNPVFTTMVAPDMIGTMTQNIAELCGCSEETASYIAMGVQLAAQITVAVAMMVVSGGAGSAAAIGSIARGIMIAAQVVQGALLIAEGSTNVAVAALEYQVADAQADKLDIDTVLAKMQKQLEDMQEEIKKLIQMLEEGNQMISQMLMASGATQIQQVKNIV